MIRFFQAAIFLLLFTGMNMTAIAQSDNSCPCCTDPYRDFDFWIGNWEVFDTSGKIVGHNRISSAQDSCLLVEQWTSATSKHRGASQNFFDRRTGRWKQVWVDNSGLILELEGGWNGEEMVLVSEQLLNKQNQPVYHRIRWKPDKEGSVRQVWEVLDLKGGLLQLFFDGRYVRKD